MNLDRGVHGHETRVVWCVMLEKNDMVIHLHQPWWKIKSKISRWVHRDTDASRIVVLPVPKEAWNDLTACETWMEAAALLRPMMGGKS